MKAEVTLILLETPFPPGFREGQDQSSQSPGKTAALALSTLKWAESPRRPLSSSMWTPPDSRSFQQIPRTGFPMPGKPVPPAKGTSPGLLHPQGRMRAGGCVGRGGCLPRRNDAQEVSVSIWTTTQGGMKVQTSWGAKRAYVAASKGCIGPLGAVEGVFHFGERLNQRAHQNSNLLRYSLVPR